MLAVLEGAAEEAPRVVADLATIPPADRPEVMGATRDRDYRLHTHLASIRRYLDDITHYGHKIIDLIEETHSERVEAGKAKSAPKLSQEESDE